MIDALPAESFRGQRVNYARPGYITGARNLPYQSFIAEATAGFISNDAAPRPSIVTTKGRQCVVAPLQGSNRWELIGPTGPSGNGLRGADEGRHQLAVGVCERVDVDALCGEQVFGVGEVVHAGWYDLDVGEAGCCQ